MHHKTEEVKIWSVRLEEVSVKQIDIVVLLLGEVVKEKINEHLKGKQIVAIYDEFLCGGTHYIESLHGIHCQ